MTGLTPPIVSSSNGSTAEAPARPAAHPHRVYVEELVDLPQHLICGHVAIETEVIKQLRRFRLRPIIAKASNPLISEGIALKAR
jgi:hypothetical protein